MVGLLRGRPPFWRAWVHDSLGAATKSRRPRMKSTTMSETTPSGPWRSRIVGHGEEAPDQLVANPAKWRTHPGPQRDALRGSLGEVGWVAEILVNRTTGLVVDGHARV